MSKKQVALLVVVMLFDLVLMFGLWHVTKTRAVDDREWCRHHQSLPWIRQSC